MTSENLGIISADINLLNQFIKDKKDLYELLSTKSGYILPRLDSKCITKIYLQGILVGQFWAPHYKQFSPSRSLSLILPKRREDLMNILKELIPAEKKLGFDMFSLPDKRWLIDCIHSLSANHQIFTGREEDQAVLQRQIRKGIKSQTWKLYCLLPLHLEFELPANLPPVLMKVRRKGFFTKSKAERDQEEEMRDKNKRQKLESQHKHLYEQIKQVDVRKELVQKKPQKNAPGQGRMVDETLE